MTALAISPERVDEIVLTRLVPNTVSAITAIDVPTEAKLGLYLDLESTSKDPLVARITELALVPFAYLPDGDVLVIERGVSWLNDPGIPIPEEASKVSGITDAMVRGQSIDWPHVHGLYTDASILVAHNAGYDRKVFERALRVAMPDASLRKPWACSYADVPWREQFGAQCAKLGCLLQQQCRVFFDAHRALDDAQAGLYLLTAASVEGFSAFRVMLENARRPTIRVSAIGAPFEVKNALKERGYSWDSVGRVWWRDVKAGEDVAEREWLAAHARCSRPGTFAIDATNRYSNRI